jgi:hypothetical protein
LPPATKKMDDLLSDKSDSPEGTFANIKVVFLDSAGAILATREKALDSDDSFTIASGHGQVVSGEMSNVGKKLTITLTSSNGAEPLVEAKQHKQQRRYIVANAGPIEKVDFKSAGGAKTNLFDNTKNPDKKSVYTMVILT